jgi:hypothetical protein
VCIGAKRDRSPHSRSITDSDRAASKALNLCLKSGNGSILLGDPHLEVGKLGEENRGVINVRVHLGIACITWSNRYNLLGLVSVLIYSDIQLSIFFIRLKIYIIFCISIVSKYLSNI